MILLIPKSKEDEIDYNKDVIYRFIDFDLDDLVRSFGFEIDKIDRVIENNKTIMRYFVVDYIADIIDIFPIDIIDAKIEEYEEIIDRLPNFEDRREVENWIISVKMRDELKIIREILVDEMKERLGFLKGCIFVEILENKELCMQKIKEMFPDYIVFEG